jgi:hypothetical protein
LVYIGPRPNDSVEVHNEFSGGENYHFKYYELMNNNKDIFECIFENLKKMRSLKINPYFKGNLSSSYLD